MKQYVLEGPGSVVCKDGQIPTPGDREVLVRITHVGICGSDIHLFKGSYNGPHQYPMLFGHEWAGVVEQTGPGVTQFTAGEHVTGDCSRYCGECDYCRSDKNLCAHIEKFGITIDGASAEYVLRDERYLYKAPAGVENKLLCLCEPVAVAAHLLRKVKAVAGDLHGKKILVLGGGVIGMAAMMLLVHMDGCEVDLYDLSAYRTGIAATAGAHIPAAAELAGGAGDGSYADLYAKAKYDVVIETTGNAGVFANALYLLRPTGILGCVGMINAVEIAQKLIVTKSLTVVGSIGGTGEFGTAIRFLQEHPAQAEKLVSHYIDASADAAVDAFNVATDAGHSMKVVLVL